MRGCRSSCSTSIKSCVRVRSGTVAGSSRRLRPTRARGANRRTRCAVPLRRIPALRGVGATSARPRRRWPDAVDRRRELRRARRRTRPGRWRRSWRARLAEGYGARMTAGFCWPWSDAENGRAAAAGRPDRRLGAAVEQQGRASTRATHPRGRCGPPRTAASARSAASTPHRGSSTTGPG